MSGFGLIWLQFEPDHELVARFGFEESLKLPILLEGDLFRAATNGEEFGFGLEQLIFGMLVMLEPHEKKLVPFDEAVFVKGLKHLGHSFGDEDCKRMINLAITYMQNEQTPGHVASIARTAHTYFGISHYFVGDN